MRKTGVQPTLEKFLLQVAFIPLDETLDVSNLEAQGTPLREPSLAPSMTFNLLHGEFCGDAFWKKHPHTPAKTFQQKGLLR